MKNKKGLIIFGSIGLVCVLAGVLLLLLLPGKSKKELYTEAITKSLGLHEDKAASDEITNSVEEFEKMINNHIYKISLKGEINMGEAGHNEAESIVYFGKNQLYMDGLALLNDQKISGNILLKDDNLYFNIKDLLKKYYYIENISQYFKDNGETEVVRKVVDYFVESFKESINEDEVKTDSKELTINGNTYNAKTYGYTFTGNTLYTVLSNFIEKIRNDKNILSELNKLLKSTEIASEFGDFELNQSDLNSALDQLLEACKSVKELGNLFTYTVYMYKDDVISRQITINIPSEQGMMPVVIADYNVVESGKMYYKAAVTAMGMNILNVEVKQQSDTKYSISASFMQQELLTGEYIKDSNGIKLTLEGSAELPTTIKLELVMNNNGTGSLEIEYEETKGSFEYEVEEVDEIPEVDVTDSEPYTEISEEEMDKVEEFFSSFIPKSEFDLEEVTLNKYEA